MKYTRDFQKLKLQKLADPAIAEGYLKDAAKTPGLLLRALGNVLQAHEIATIAKESGLARENLYRAFSDQGNPQYDTLTGVLEVLGLRLDIVRIGENTAQPSPSPSGHIGESRNEASIGASGTSSNAIAKPGPQLAWINPGIAQAVPRSDRSGLRGTKAKVASLGRISNG